ncbi:MAG: EAL domain-containing protein [Spirochaetaceae bacterium]|nr:EAL domain-containing protein [Spirochaetaceae bacterium]
MSWKKDLKIKRLRYRSIIPRVLGICFVDAIVIAFVLFFCYLIFLGQINNYLFSSHKDSLDVVQAINTNWNTNTVALNMEIEQVKKRNSNIQDVYIVDDNLNIINSFGSEPISFETVFMDEDVEEDLADHGMVRGELDVDEIALSFFNLKDKIKNVINFVDIVTDKRVIDSLSEEIMFPTQWVLYKTDVNNINVCIKNCYPISSYTYNVILVICVCFAAAILVTAVYELRKIGQYILEQKKINKLFSTDTVTGGNNKEYFLQKGARLIRAPRKVAIVQLRLEKYHNFCSAYGVKVGENLLEEIHEKLSSLVGKKELAAHLEKADFVLLLYYKTTELLNERLNSIINELTGVRKTQHLLFSAGVCEVKSRNDDINDLLTSVGLAVSKVSESTENIVWFNESMKEEQVWERRIEDDMETAIMNHEFQVYLQPKYSTKGEKLAAAEALVRWIHPKLGFVNPGKFIPIFEQNGFIIQLDDYMLTAVAKLQAKWLSEGKKLVPVSVNVSRAHFTCDDLAEHICRIIDKYKVPHEYIELELTESAFFDDKEVLLKTVRQLKSYGFKVSMDDFGAGYSSLNSLKELPLDIIKLDAEFFRSVDDLTRSNLIVGDTISLAKKLGMQIVAEGIETREQVDFLAKQHCDLIQGFYFSKPLPVSEFEQRAYGV